MLLLWDWNVWPDKIYHKSGNFCGTKNFRLCGRLWNLTIWMFPPLNVYTMNVFISRKLPNTQYFLFPIYYQSVNHDGKVSWRITYLVEMFNYWLLQTLVSEVQLMTIHLLYFRHLIKWTTLKVLQSLAALTYNILPVAVFNKNLLGVWHVQHILEQVWWHWL